MPNELDDARVAEIIVTRSDGKEFRGSGYRVTSTAVLTARHVLDDLQAVEVRFDGGLTTSWTAPADIGFADPDSELAILVVKPDSRWREVTPSRFGRLDDRAAKVDVDVAGFPRWKLRTRRDGTMYRVMAHVIGRVPSLANRREATFEINVAPPAEEALPRTSPWEGMSGGPVFKEDRLIGVVTSHYEREGLNRLAAVRVDTWLDWLHHEDRALPLRLLEPTELTVVRQLECIPADGRTMLPGRLVERPRQETWWHGMETVFFPPQFPDPVVDGEWILVALGNLVYRLNRNFGYAVRGEYPIRSEVALTSSPHPWGKGKVALTALLGDGRFQGITIDTATSQMDRRTLLTGRPYTPGYLLEDRYPVNPAAHGDSTSLFSPHGHMIVLPDGRQATLGENVRLRNDPAVCGRNIILHLETDAGTWLEWRSIESFEKVRSTQPWEPVFGIMTGHVSTSPLVHGDYVVCGFGERLVCFTDTADIVWEFPYPQLDALDQGEPLQMIVGAEVVDGKVVGGEVVYETNSEVCIGSNLYADGEHLYFVLSEGTRHVSYLTKVEISSGVVEWTCQVDGFSSGFNIAGVSARGVVLQHGTWLWAVSQAGRIVEEFELDIDCTSCSGLVKLNSTTYVVLANLGVHVVELHW